MIPVCLLPRLPSVLERKASLVALSTSVPSVVVNSPTSSPNKVMIPPVFGKWYWMLGTSAVCITAKTTTKWKSVFVTLAKSHV